ncbi:MAG: flavin-containing monooxygenase [Gammaproteobacteria bacterium]
MRAGTVRTAPVDLDKTTDILDTLIIGAGFGGLGAAIALKKRDQHNFLILEKEQDLGGTWLVNRYPGCGCDVASHLYSYSFAPNTSWSRSFSGSEEIWRYLKDCAAQFKLDDHLRFGHAVERLAFDEGNNVWRVALDDGSELVARAVILATGALSKPAEPDIAGLDKFGGRLFHSQSWDHDYDLKDKRVAVIGTGASAIQFVPHVAKRAASVTLFQRTPPWILPKPDRRISAIEHSLFRRVPGLQKLLRGFIYVTNELRAIAFVYQPGLLRMFEWLAKRHIRRSIADPALRATVTPDYRIGCKRVLISNDYYPALTRDHVEVVTQGVEALDETGVIAVDGTHTPVDAVVLGTGFNVTAPFDAGFIRGLNGLDLATHWQAGPEAYLGTVIAGFPNLFMLAGPNTALGHNSMIYMLESQIEYVMAALDYQRKHDVSRLDVNVAVQQRYNDKVQGGLAGSVWNTGGCTSWYKHPSGRNVALWPDFTWRFRARTRRLDPRDFQP